MPFQHRFGCQSQAHRRGRRKVKKCLDKGPHRYAVLPTENNRSTAGIIPDTGSVTILWSQPVSGLQILSPDGKWRWVRHIDNALVRPLHPSPMVSHRKATGHQHRGHDELFHWRILQTHHPPGRPTTARPKRLRQTRLVLLLRARRERKTVAPLPQPGVTARRHRATVA